MVDTVLQATKKSKVHTSRKEVKKGLDAAIRDW